MKHLIFFFGVHLCCCPLFAQYTEKEVSSSVNRVIVFLNPDCPICQKYSPVLAQLYKQYQSKNIRFQGYVPVKTVKNKEIKAYRESYGLIFPIKKDKHLAHAQHLKAVTTPEVFLLNESGDVLYRGKIDNWYYQLGKFRIETTEFYLKDAIETVLKKEVVVLKVTQPLGCLIEY